jgi:hypothetical protein
VDVAWDPVRAVAHVVWAAGAGAGERPTWAAVAPGDRAEVVARGDLAPPGRRGSVLVSIAPTPDGGALAAYRRADRSGFFSRALVGPPRAPRWQPELRVPADSNFGSVSLVIDGDGTAHLALRDDVDPALAYFRKPAGRSWGPGEVAVEADGTSVEEVDFPTLSVDESSNLVYLFFQNAALDPSPQIRVLVRDPSDGWQGSYQVIHPDAVEDGANFPVAAGTVTGSAAVLWTRKGPIPTVQIARFIAP